MDIDLKPRRTAQFFTLIVMCLTLAHIALLITRFYFGSSFGLALFDLDNEKNIPTLFSSVALLFCSGLLWIIALSKRKENSTGFLYWVGLAAIFIFLSIDETATIHEQFNDPIRSTLNTSGFLSYAWVIPYMILVGILFLAYLKFIISLPKKTRFLFIIAGTIYVGGAIGLELLGNYHFDLYGENDVKYLVFSSIEEVLEMTGIVVFIYALMSYISTELEGVQLRISH